MVDGGSSAGSGGASDPEVTHRPLSGLADLLKGS
jgi:hypothetical protein